MSARRPKTARKRRSNSKRREQQSTKERRLAHDRRPATTEYVPVRNHRVVGLLVRMSDMRLGEGPALWPHFEPGQGLAFLEGFRFWPERVIDVRNRIVIGDWVERSVYSTVEL